MRKLAPLFLGIASGVQLTLSGLTDRNAGDAAATWLPQTSFGVMVVLFLLAVYGATRVGEDPLDTDGFTLAHWTAVVGFGLWGCMGLAYLAVGYRSIFVWPHVIAGVGGVLLVLRER